MTDTRQKLIEILSVPIYPHLDADPAEVVADYLLDNGVTVQETGHWEAHKPDCRGYTAGFKCSNCGEIVYTDYSMKECEYDYCPKCGAKMGADNHDNADNA